MACCGRLLGVGVRFDTGLEGHSLLQGAVDGLPRIVFVSPPNPFDIECCDAFAEALADDFFWLIDVLAGRRVEGTRGCALFPRALRLRPWRRRAFLARWSALPQLVRELTILFPNGELGPKADSLGACVGTATAALNPNTPARLRTSLSRINIASYPRQGWG